MLCAWVEPSETYALLLSWASWMILDFIVEQLGGKHAYTKVIVAIFVFIGVAILSRSCSTTASKHER
jgi:hypothetical protein